MGRQWGAGQYLHGAPEIEYARLLEIVAWYEGYWEGQEETFKKEFKHDPTQQPIAPETKPLR